MGTLHVLVHETTRLQLESWQGRVVVHKVCEPVSAALQSNKQKRKQIVYLLEVVSLDL